MIKLLGLDNLGFRIISLISCGITEDVIEVEREMSNGTLVTYLNEKYKEELRHDFKGYDIEELNKHFQSLSHLATPNEARRKFGIVNENDGLLLTLAIILEGLDLPTE